MIFTLLSILVPVVVYFGLPALLARIVPNSQFHAGLAKPIKSDKATHKILILACVAYFISWYLPSPLIDGQHTAFTTHFVGGGIFTGLLWLYILRATNWKARLTGNNRSQRYSLYRCIEAATLFMAVSALGTLNELFELAVVQSGFSNLTLNDTSWDLLANTLGAALFYVIYLLVDSSNSNLKTKPSSLSR